MDCMHQHYAVLSAVADERRDDVENNDEAWLQLLVVIYIADKNLKLVNFMKIYISLDTMPKFFISSETFFL